MKSLNILYISAHEILEHDELKILGELGHQYLSLGAFYDPNNQQGTLKRPALPAEYNLFDKYHGTYDRMNLTEEQIKWADVVIIMHHPESESQQPWLVKNWQKFKNVGVPVVYRSIGQSCRMVERILKPLKDDGLKIIRYSPMEENIPHYCGSDALIRFYIDEEEWKGWEGSESRVITVSQSMKKRGSSCNFDAFQKVTESFERRLYGPGNETSGVMGGELSFDALKEVYRKNRCYFYSGTQPASYTLNFLEAFVTGIPIVALGPKHCNKDYPEQQTYEVHKIIENGVNGYCSDNPEELKDYIWQLLNNYDLAKKIGDAGRKTAIELFGKQQAKEKWKTFLEELTK